ncbi:unnamed protein product [Aspergillus oryzae]|nr:unnamed protein product [Aspergillus oryzae]
MTNRGRQNRPIISGAKIFAVFHCSAAERAIVNGTRIKAKKAIKSRMPTTSRYQNNSLANFPAPRSRMGCWYVSTLAVLALRCPTSSVAKRGMVQTDMNQRRSQFYRAFTY